MILDYRLKVFYLTAKYGSFTRAARELDISQPAVSQNIAELEQDIRADLFIREPGRPVTLSPKGKVLFGYAERILSLYEALNAELVPGAWPSAEPVVLRIASVHLAVQYILPEAIKRYSRICPHVSFSVLERDDAGVKALVGEGEADIGITSCTLGDSSVPLAELRMAGSPEALVPLYATSFCTGSAGRLVRSFIVGCLTL